MSSIAKEISNIKCLLFSYILDINECWTYPCHGNATCNNTIGSYMCACDPGYSGDGFNCTGMHLTPYPANIENTVHLHSC